MKAIILVAGYATRLYPLTLNRPKALLRINNKPILEFIIEKVKRVKKIEEIILVSNNKFYPLFEKWLKEYDCKNIKLINDLTNSEEDRLGAIGDLEFAVKKRKIATDTLVIAGDNLFDFSLNSFIKEVSNKDCISMGVYDIKDIQKATKFGVVELEKSGYVAKFKEKPQKPFSTFIGTGVYYIPVDKLNFINMYLKQKYSLDALGHFIEYLLKKKEKVYGYRFEGKWFDIGDKGTYREAKNYFEERS